MPMNFLRRIENASFPLLIHEEADIHCAAVLAAAQLLEANLPEPGQLADQGAVILRITPMGRAELRRLRDRGDDFAAISLQEFDDCSPGQPRGLNAK
ncbi:hypothetical protein VVAX_03515 [Variovorax paradoxus]|uniref:Uncharacterized protein n=2 Tax=Variovorax paradoxus TaxID=34073 RepID=A0A679J473_VARPD|nr:hypothetical protein VVAX_03515 [Variovorax paradoxus]